MSESGRGQAGSRSWVDRIPWDRIEAALGRNQREMDSGSPPLPWVYTDSDEEEEGREEGAQVEAEEGANEEAAEVEEEPNEDDLTEDDESDDDYEDSSSSEVSSSSEEQTFGQYDPNQSALRDGPGRVVFAPSQLTHQNPRRVPDNLQPGLVISARSLEAPRPPAVGERFSPPVPNQWACTEMIPWGANALHWTHPCPSVNDPTMIQDLCVCEDPRCPRICEWGHHEPFPCPDAPCPREGEREAPPGVPANPWGKRFVCDEHFRDTVDFWAVKKLYEAHRVSVCDVHRREFRATYPDGRNTCTCHNLLERRYCRRCYERAVQKLQMHFRNRVEPLSLSPLPGINRRITRRRDYHLRSRQVRMMLARTHPCHHRCGRARLANNTDVMDCRACGGIIVQPTPLIVSRETWDRERFTRRSRRDAGEPLIALDQRGAARVVEHVDRPGDDAQDEAVAPTEEPDYDPSDPGVKGDDVNLFKLR